MPKSTRAAPHEMVVRRMPDNGSKMITFGNIFGCLYDIDEDGRGTGFDDLFTKIDMCRGHHAAIGLGTDYAERFVR